jgi:N-acetylmuramoyl-L-alanine amidase
MKYAVGAGHTKKGIGTGAVGKINESIETRVVAPLVVNYLRLVGEEAELLVVDEITKPLDDCRWRADRANELKASRYDPSCRRPSCRRDSQCRTCTCGTSASHLAGLGNAQPPCWLWLWQP